MPDRPQRPLLLIAGLLAGLAISIAAPVAAQGGAGANPYRQVLEQHSDAVVTVRFVLKVEVGGGMGGAMGDGQEIETEITGLMIDPGGLILCSNTQIGGFAGLLSRILGGGDFDISATPNDIEVLVGDATEGVAARLVARDSELDLAWLQIEEPGDGGFAAVDLGASVAAEIGEPFIALRRLDKVFARAPALIEGRIGGAVTKPRRLYIPATSGFDGYGLPVFNTDGQLLGFTVVQVPEEDEAPSAGMAAMFQSARLQEMLAATILPAAEVSRATELARNLAATGDANGTEATEDGAVADGAAEAAGDDGAPGDSGQGDDDDSEVSDEPGDDDAAAGSAR